jgi:ubiquinone/menaquinone biosynthesis C-methylase UbiE
MDRDEYRRTSLEAWQGMAAGWERSRERIEEVSTPVREWLVRAIAARPGDTVLELAAGPGDTGFEVAAGLGESGRLISTDRAPAMVDVARRRAAELGLQNVEHRALDAENMELEDDSVDHVLCRFGYMLMADPARALAETRRVLRSGGRLALAVWSTADRNPWVSIAGRMFVARGHVEPPEPGAPGMFTMANEERTRDLLEDAGFTDVRMEEVPVRFTFDDVDEYVRRSMETGGMFATIFGGASEEEQAEMKAELDKAFASFAVDGGFVLPGVALCAVAS